MSTPSQMSDKPNDDPKESAERVVEHNEKFNVPVQTEEKRHKSLKMQHRKI
jgi:hypothetical protein